MATMEEILAEFDKGDLTYAPTLPTCPNCGAIFSSLQQHWMHGKSWVGSPEGRLYRCPGCSMVFKAADWSDDLPELQIDNPGLQVDRTGVKDLRKSD